jgi:hypothetical protein
MVPWDLSGRRKEGRKRKKGRAMPAMISPLTPAIWVQMRIQRHPPWEERDPEGGDDMDREVQSTTGQGRGREVSIIDHLPTSRVSDRPSFHPEMKITIHSKRVLLSSLPSLARVCFNPGLASFFLFSVTLAVSLPLLSLSYPSSHPLPASAGRV